LNFSSPSHLEGFDLTGKTIVAATLASNNATPVQIASVAGSGILLALHAYIAANADLYDFEIIVDGVTLVAYGSMIITGKATTLYWGTIPLGIKFATSLVVNSKMGASDTGASTAVVMYG